MAEDPGESFFLFSICSRYSGFSLAVVARGREWRLECGRSSAAPRRAATVGNVLFQQLRQPTDDFRVGLVFIGAFADILGHVVELDRRKVLRFFAPGLRHAPAAGAGAEFEFPLPLPDREGAVDGMMDDGLVQGFVRLAQ